MAKIRFWKWQHTDELGLPSVTRFPISDLDREMANHREQNAWPLETSNPKKSPTEFTLGVRPK
jgi:hypothetical protein